MSENLYIEQRKYIEKILECRVFSFYGHSERLLMAAECEYSTEYHIVPWYGYAEILDESNHPILQPGIEGELVVTGFINRSMPLIRYKTGDYAMWGEQQCKCGRLHKRLKYVTGHWEQTMLLGFNGEKVSLAAINMHSKSFEHIIKYQFYQEERGTVVFKYVPAKSFDDARDLSVIREELVEKLGNGFRLQFQKVTNIPLGKNGKYKFIDQKLDGWQDNNEILNMYSSRYR